MQNNLLLQKTLLLIPTLNEAQAIAGLINQAKQTGFKDILVLDGNSKDGTPQIALKQGAKVMFQEGKGKGMAFQTFLKKHEIKPDWNYLMIDGDASYKIADLKKILHALKTADVASGARQIFVDSPKRFMHLIGGTGISIIGSGLFLKFNPDICTGVWGFKGSALKKMKITAKGFELEANLFAQTAKKRLKFATVPIAYGARKGKEKLVFTDAFKIVAKLFQERLSS